MISNDVEYIQACTEVNCLLKYFPKEYIEKIPNKLMNMIKSKSDEKYNITVDLNKDLISQNISKKATDLLVVLKYNYWSNDTEREIIKQKLYENEKNFQEELSRKYSADDLFQNNKKQEESADKEEFALVEYNEPKKSFFSKILSKIKSIFKR